VPHSDVFLAYKIGWFHLLAAIGGGAASAALFASYLAAFLPWVAHGSNRALLLFILIAIPTAANYVGVRSGARLSTLLTLLKLLLLALIIGLGVIRFSHHVELLHASEITSPGRASWLSAVARRNIIRRRWRDFSPKAGLSPACEQELLSIMRTCAEPGRCVPCSPHRPQAHADI
jgi:amino acid transporter